MAPGAVVLFRVEPFKEPWVFLGTLFLELPQEFFLEFCNFSRNFGEGKGESAERTIGPDDPGVKSLSPKTECPEMEVRRQSEAPRWKLSADGAMGK
ncbi:unnamed protein product [Acanthocheilonema viteae]|uniref:Uncharacterized protein n=1 Tax=Acanthocheilonema viteae TaxID=6277 RepID=A0A498SVS9_ACAVI|nr:unnamed protein product [Acanthocheilonema viteae]